MGYPVKEKRTGLAENMRLVKYVVEAFPETKLHNLQPRYNALQKRRKKGKVSKQARKRNR